MDSNSFRGYSSAYLQIKNFNFIELLILSCISILILIWGALGGTGDYRFMEMSFGFDPWIRRTYSYGLIVLIVACTLLWRRYFLSKFNKGTVLLIAMFTYLISFIICAPIRVELFANEDYKYIGISNFYCNEIEGVVNRIPGPIEEYEIGPIHDCHSLSDDYCNIFDKNSINHLLAREGKCTITNKFIYAATAVACGYQPYGTALNEREVNCSHTVYDLSSYFEYLYTVSPDFFKELFITTVSKIGWIIQTLLLHIMLFYVKSWQVDTSSTKAEELTYRD